MTSSELKYQHERNNPDGYFFCRKTMSFFGDTMRNYAVSKQPVTIKTPSGDNVECYELRRKRAVRHGNTSSAFFACYDFRIVHEAI